MFVVRSGDRGSCSDNRSVHRAHRRLLFLTARHHRARSHRIRHVLGPSDCRDDHQKRCANRRWLFSAGLRHGQQRSRHLCHLRHLPDRQLQLQLYGDSSDRPMTGNPATTISHLATSQNSRLPDTLNIYFYDNYIYIR